MFGETAAKLLLYIAPVLQSDLLQYNYDSPQIADLLAEKAGIVFSYLPRKYREIYKARVERLVVVDFAFDGQTSVAAPFTAMTNVLGFVNPCGCLRELKEATTTVVTPNAGNLDFSALSLGDRLVISFDNDMSSVEIKPLIWAVNVLAAMDLLSIISGDTTTGDLIPRIRSDSERVGAWLEALRMHKDGERVIIQELEYNFWHGEKLALDVHDWPFESKQKWVS